MMPHGNLWGKILCRERYPLVVLSRNCRKIAGCSPEKQISHNHCGMTGCGHKLTLYPNDKQQSGGVCGNSDQRAVSSCAGALKLGQHQLNGFPGRADLRRPVSLPTMHRGLVDAEALGESGLRLTEADARVFDHLWGNRHAVIMHSA